ESVPPLVRLEFGLSPWSSYVIVPLFALANAGVAISGDEIGGFLANEVTMGVFLGLLIGKPLGITGAAWLAVRLGLAKLPTHSTWRHIIGLGFLGGIGFTVALFVSALSFPAGS